MKLVRIATLLLAVFVAACPAPPLPEADSVEHYVDGDHEIFYVRDLVGTAALEADELFETVELHFTLAQVELRVLDAAGESIIEWTPASDLTEDSEPVAWEGVVVLERPGAMVEVRAASALEFGRVSVGRGELRLHDADAEPLEVGTETLVARPGRWIPPASVLTIANQQYLPYTGAPRSCAGTFKPGTRELADFLKRSFVGATSYGGYACRANTANTSQLSVHASGRAIDLFVPLHGGAADNDLGDPIANYLIKNAVAIGIEYVIWDRTSWGAHRAAPKHREYTGPHPHHDHLHIEVSPTAASATGRTFPPVNSAPACACSPGATQSQGCGNCGRRTRSCRSNCQWGSWGSCSGQGPCAPGDRQHQDCGNCGSRTRVCSSSCGWNAWGSCGGQGPCAPGAREDRACGDCGSQSRQCSGTCAWGSYDACEGPDPEGAAAVCNTGKLGACEEGRNRCRQGNLRCEDTHAPTAELCDDIDNDCNGSADEGGPQSLGSTPPRFGAELLDASWPRGMTPGEAETVWVDFRNVGSEVWPAGQVWLQAGSGLVDQPSPFYDSESWAAWDVAAVARHPTAPGEVARLAFKVQVDAEASFTEEFFLRNPEGVLIGCPTPSFAVSVERSEDSYEVAVPAPTPPPAAPPTPPPAPTVSSVEASGYGCQAGKGAVEGAWLLLLLFPLRGLRRLRSAP